MLKISILSISLLTIMASAAISPALGVISEAFPHISPTFIKLIITLPSMLIIPFSFISGKLTDFFNKKTVLYMGLITYLTGGIAGGFTSDITTLLIFRALLGVGVGLIMPISTALIADFFKGEEASQMTGWATASSNLGGIIAVIFSGWLATFSWRYSFGVYLLGVFALIFVKFFLPEPEKKSDKTNSTKKLPVVTYMASLAAFLMMTSFYAVPTNIAIFLKTNNLGNANTAGITLAIVTSAAFVAGIALIRVQKIFKKLMLPFQMALMSSGFGILSISGSLSTVVIGVTLIGFSFGNLYPMILLLIVRGVPREQNVRAMAIVSSCIFFGQFFSPVFFDTAGALFGNTDIKFIFVLNAYLIGVTTLVFLIKINHGKGKKAIRMK